MANDVIQAAYVAGVNLFLIYLFFWIWSRLQVSTPALRLCSLMISLWAVIAISAFLAQSLGFFSWPIIYAIGLVISLALYYAVIRFAPEATDNADSDAGTPSYRVAVYVLFGLAAAQCFCFGVLQFPVDWDSLAYHLPLVDYWIQSESLASTQSMFWYVPGNSELLSYWIVAPFSGDYWAQVPNLVICLFLGCTLVSIAEEIGLNEIWSLLLLIAICASQPIVRQLSSAENDVAAAALFASSILFGLRFLRSCSHTDSLLTALSIGLLCGIKYYALGYAAIVLGMAAFLSWRTSGLATAIRFSAYCIAGMVVFAGYWYARNFMLGGSPLFPLGLQMFGMENPWGEMRPGTWRSNLIGGSTLEVWGLLAWAWFTQSNLFAFCSAAMAPLIGASLLWRSTESDGNHARRLLGMVLLGSLLIYLITPNVIETKEGSLNMLRYQYHSVRLGMPFLLICVLAGVAAISNIQSVWLTRGIPLLLLVVILGLVIHLAPQYGLRHYFIRNDFSFWRNPTLDHSWWFWLATSGGCCAVTWLYFEACRRKKAWIGPALVAIFFCLATPFLAHRWHRDFSTFYARQLDRQVDKQIIKEHQDERVCFCEHRPYPAIGSRREVHVHSPVFIPDSPHLVDFLHHHGIDFVAVPRVDRHWTQRYANASRWMARERDFVEVYRELDYVVFRRRSSNGNASGP